MLCLGRAPCRGGGIEDGGGVGNQPGFECRSGGCGFVGEGCLLSAPGPGDEGHDGALHGKFGGGVGDGVDVGEEFDGQVSKTPWVGGVLETLDDFLADGWANEGKEGEGGDGGCCGGWGHCGLVEGGRVGCGSLVKVGEGAVACGQHDGSIDGGGARHVCGVGAGSEAEQVWGSTECGGGCCFRWCGGEATHRDWCAISSWSGLAPCGFPWSLRAWFILHRMVGRCVGSVP